MRKIRILIIIVLLFAICVSGCGSLTEDDDKISIVCTNFPVYDWVNKIVAGETAEKFEVILLGSNGDLHSYQPTAQDIAEIKTCDLFIYIGGVSDGWTDAVIRDSNIKTLRLFDFLDGELLCTDHDHNHGEKHDAEEYDEHIWLSPRMAQKSFDAICGKVIELVPEYEAEFAKNKEECKKKFEQLDESYRTAVSESLDKTIVFADRFPFLYMTEEYGIEAVAAFPGCSADSDASFEVIARLAEAVDNKGKKTVLVLENSNQSVAKTVIESTKNKNAEILVMNSFQTIGKNEIEQGISYFEIMEENLKALKKALE